MSDKIKFDIVSEKLINTKTCNKLIDQIKDCFWPSKIDNVVFTIQPSAFKLKLTEPDIEKKQTRKFKKNCLQNRQTCR